MGCETDGDVDVYDWDDSEDGNEEDEGDEAAMKPAGCDDGATAAGNASNLSHEAKGNLIIDVRHINGNISGCCVFTIIASVISCSPFFLSFLFLLSSPLLTHLPIYLSSRLLRVCCCLPLCWRSWMTPIWRFAARWSWPWPLCFIIDPNSSRRDKQRYAQHIMQCSCGVKLCVGCKIM